MVYAVSLGCVILSKVVPCPFPSCYSRTSAPSSFLGSLKRVWLTHLFPRQLWEISACDAGEIHALTASVSVKQLLCAERELGSCLRGFQSDSHSSRGSGKACDYEPGGKGAGLSQLLKERDSLRTRHKLMRTSGSKMAEKPTSTGPAASVYTHLTHPESA